MEEEEAKAKVKAKADEACLSTDGGPLILDQAHHEWESGDWRCGYCGNANRSSRGQEYICNLRYCGAKRYTNFKMELMSDVETMNQMPGSFAARGKKASKGGAGLKPVRGPQPAPVRDEAAEAAAAAMAVPQWGKQKEPKRVSLYANQNGGAANPSKKKKRRQGAPSGPQH